MDDSGLVGIYLAAGKSSRMGSSKLNLLIENQCLGSIALRAALESKLDVTIAVTRQGDSLHWFAPFLNEKGLKIVECKEADIGQSASIRAGVKAALELGAEGVVVMLADQPFVTTGMINGLIDKFHVSEEYPYISFSHHGVPKPPVLFRKSLFPALVELEGDQGARALIRGAGKGNRMELEDDIYFYDIDTIEDYQYLLENRYLLF